MGSVIRDRMWDRMWLLIASHVLLHTYLVSAFHLEDLTFPNSNVELMDARQNLNFNVTTIRDAILSSSAVQLVTLFASGASLAILATLVLNGQEAQPVTRPQVVFTGPANRNRDQYYDNELKNYEEIENGSSVGGETQNPQERIDQYPEATDE